MAYPKFQLDERTRYQLLQAVYLSLRLISTVENEDDGPFAIALELQDAASWDDVAVFPSDPTKSATEHWQIKFQTTPLKRAILEVMFRSAWDLLSRNNNLNFRIGLSTPVATTVGKKLTMMKLGELCRRLQAPGSPGENAPASLRDEALKGWYEFTRNTLDNDDSAAKRLLERMRVEDLGSHESLIEKTNDVLRQWYLEPDQARLAIQNVLQQGTPLSRIRFEDLAPGLESIQRTGASRLWTSFRHTTEKWWQRGSVSDKSTVASIWGNDGRSPEVRILAPSESAQRLGPLLVRLVLHGSHGSTVSCTDRDGWRQRARNHTGGTLGDSSQDIVDEVFVSSCERRTPPAIQPRSDQTVDEGALADNLKQQMDLDTWERVTAAVRATATAAPSTQHATILVNHLPTFEQVLGHGSAAGPNLLYNALRADFEPPRIRGDVRCGPRTVSIIANTLLLLVMLRVTFGTNLNLNNDGTVDIDGIPVRTLALTTCYNPDEARIDFILDHLRRIAFGGGGFLVLGGTETPVSGLYDVVTTQLEGSFAQSRAPSLKSEQPQPDILLPWGPDARHALKNGIEETARFIRRLVRHSSVAHQERLAAMLDAISADEGEPDGGTPL